MFENATGNDFVLTSVTLWKMYGFFPSPEAIVFEKIWWLLNIKISCKSKVM